MEPVAEYDGSGRTEDSEELRGGAPLQASTTDAIVVTTRSRTRSFKFAPRSLAASQVWTSVTAAVWRVRLWQYRHRDDGKSAPTSFGSAVGYGRSECRGFC